MMTTAMRIFGVIAEMIGMIAVTDIVTTSLI